MGTTASTTLDTDATLAEVERLVVQMFTLVSERLGAATTAFLSGDRAMARSVVAGDREVDDLQLVVERQVERSLTLGRPVDPVEARRLLAVVRIAPELERSGDLIEHIALRTPQRLAERLSERALALLAEMGALAAQLWKIAGVVYAERDTGRLDELRRLDDLLDDLHVEFTTELAQGQPSVPEAIELGLIARFYERLGDHAVNVARRAHGRVGA
jgi:phosphate transport system protein